MNHGTTTGYSRGCRCDPCRQAKHACNTRYRLSKEGIKIKPDEFERMWQYWEPDDVTWMEQAACKGMDTNLFFPGKWENGLSNVAKQVCASCPVQTECRDYALVTNQQFGVWGGTTLTDRRRHFREAG